MIILLFENLCESMEQTFTRSVCCVCILETVELAWRHLTRNMEIYVQVAFT